MKNSRWAGTALVVAICATGCHEGETTTGGGAGSAASAASAGGTGGEAGTTASDGGGGTGGGTTSTGSAGGSEGGSGGTGGAVDPGCLAPLSAFNTEGSYSNPIGPWIDEDGGFFAGRLPSPFAVDTVCNAVLVGLATFSNPGICQIPATVSIAAWSDAGEVDPETGAVLPATVPTATPMPTAGATKEAYGGSTEATIFRFAMPATFKAGEPAFVAVQLQQAICAAGTKPVCDSTSSLRYRPKAPGAGWALLSDAKPDAPAQVPDVEEQLIFGVADCEAVP